MKNMKLSRFREERGVSLVELLVGMVILAVALLGLAAGSGVAAQYVLMGRADMQLWTATQEGVEELMRVDYDSLRTDSAVVQGYPMSWTVTGTNPKKVVFVVVRGAAYEVARESKKRGEKFDLVVPSDTLVLYMADPNS